MLEKVDTVERVDILFLSKGTAIEERGDMGALEE